MEINAQDLVNVLMEQRNAALNDAAQWRVLAVNKDQLIVQLQQQIADLQKEKPPADG